MPLQRVKPLDRTAIAHRPYISDIGLPASSRIRSEQDGQCTHVVYTLTGGGEGGRGLLWRVRAGRGRGGGLALDMADRRGRGSGREEEKGGSVGVGGKDVAGCEASSFKRLSPVLWGIPITC